jgi:hypothetical protein
VIGDRWGVTDAEVARRDPCDDVVRTPAFEAWRGVTVRAPASHVWPWVAQIRLAPYAYDWIDNLGRRSPRELRGLPEPRVGEPFSAAFGGRPAGRILSVEPGVQLTGLIMGTVMSYVLVPSPSPSPSPAGGHGGGGATRLLLKLAAPGRRAVTPLLCVGDLVMARRQLRTLARLAEADGGDQRGQR